VPPLGETLIHAPGAREGACRGAGRRRSHASGGFVRGDYTPGDQDASAHKHDFEREHAVGTEEDPSAEHDERELWEQDAENRTQPALPV